MSSFPRLDPALAARALAAWGPRQWTTAAASAVATAVVVGVPTVLIPNPWFGREIPPTWWSYPAWIAASVLTGLLIATYLRPAGGATAGDGPGDDSAGAAARDAAEERPRRMGVIGTMLAWFAVGCPVCNKLVLIALGSSGAMTWFAPAQPFLAVAALAVTAAALTIRLAGQVACPVPVTAS